MAAFCVAPAFAQFEMDAETAAVLAQEPPLTQADIDSFAKYFKDIDKTSSEKELERILEKAGMTPARMAYVYLKIGLVWIELEEDPGFIEKYVKVYPQMALTESEFALIADNEDKIKAIAKAMGF